MAVSLLPELTPNDIAVKLAGELAQGSRVTWKTIAHLAESSDRDPYGYVLKIFGEVNTDVIATRFKAEGLIHWQSGCTAAKGNQKKLLKEICVKYLPAILKNGCLQISSSSYLNQLKSSALLACDGDIRSVVILYCLQPIIASLPMPFPISKWHRLHRIVPIKSEPKNRDMEMYLMKIETQRIANFDFFNSLFSQNPVQVSLSLAQWIDLGRVVAGRWVLHERTKLVMFKRWLQLTREAQAAGEQFLKLIHVDAWLTNGASVSPSRESQQTFKHDLRLPVQKTYPAWELQEVFTFAFCRIFNQDASFPQEFYNRFAQAYLKLFEHTAAQSLAVYFIHKVDKKYSKLRSQVGPPDYFKAQQLFKLLRQRLDVLMTDGNKDLPVGWRPMFRFLHASLIIVHFSYLTPLSLEHRLLWFKRIHSLRRPESVDAMLLEKVIEWRKEDFIPVSINEILEKYRFGPEEEAEIFIKYIHYCLRLLPTNGSKTISITKDPSWRQMEFGEMAQCLEQLEDYLGSPLPVDIPYQLLRTLNLNVRAYKAIQELPKIRKEILISKQKFILHITKNIHELREILLFQNTVIPGSWELEPGEREKIEMDPVSPDKWKVQRIENMTSVYIHIDKLLMNATLFCTGMQDAFTRFFPGLILLGHRPKQTLLEEWCSLYRNMLTELLPGNRVILVDGEWNPTCTEFTLDVKWLHSYLRPTTRRFKGGFQTTPKQLSQTRTVMVDDPISENKPKHAEELTFFDLLKGIFRVLSDEDLHPQINLKWEHLEKDYIPELLRQFAELKDFQFTHLTHLHALYELFTKGEQGEENKQCCEAVGELALREKFAAREKLLDLILLQFDTAQSPLEQAKAGEIWKGANGISLIPVQPREEINAYFGIKVNPYFELCQRLCQRIRKEISGLNDSFCSLDVQNSPSGGSEVPVSVVWQHNMKSV